MTQENLDVVRAIYRAWQLGDYRGALERFDEDLEWFGPPRVSKLDACAAPSVARAFVPARRR